MFNAHITENEKRKHNLHNTTTNTFEFMFFCCSYLTSIFVVVIGGVVNVAIIGAYVPHSLTIFEWDTQTRKPQLFKPRNKNRSTKMYDVSFPLCLSSLLGLLSRCVCLWIFIHLSKFIFGYILRKPAFCHFN